jgi:hypothetical protein
MAQFLAKIFIPCLMAGLLLGLAWRWVVGRLRTALQWAAALLFFVPQGAVLLYLHRSVDLIVDQEAVIAGWLWLCAGLMFWKITHAWSTGEQPVDLAGRVQSPRVLLLLGVALLGFGCYKGKQFLADAFLPHQTLEGQIQNIRVLRRTRGPPDYEVYIDGQAYPVTRDLLLDLHLGERIRAELGAGSKYFLRVEQLRNR